MGLELLVVIGDKSGSRVGSVVKTSVSPIRVERADVGRWTGETGHSVVVLGQHKYTKIHNNFAGTHVNESNRNTGPIGSSGLAHF